MDLARAIHRISHKAEYRMNHSQADDAQEILTWRGPGPQPTKMMLDDAWVLCVADDAAEASHENDIAEAEARIKADPAQSDLALVLRL